MRLYNTLTRQINEIEPLAPPQVSVYTCGPTVYDYLHVGNWFTYIREDTLLRVLRLNGYRPVWVMNITDVGHLVSDADEGEDKLEKGARREGKTAWQVAAFYTAYFQQGLQRLHMLQPDYLPRATDHIGEQIALIQTLEQKGYTYTTSDGVYFDTAKFPRYADFARLDVDEQQAGARVEYNAEKRHPTDFALWKFSPKNQQRDMEWWAPWQPPGKATTETHPIGATHNQAPPNDKVTAIRAVQDNEAVNSRALNDGEMQGAAEQRTEPYESYGEGAAQAGTQQIAVAQGSWGFPGWHVECSAMSMKYLGPTLDIHAGGIDHVPVHHTNEIAQSEAATGKPFARYWMHSNHITIEGEKISKSLGNGITLEDIAARNISLEAFRLHVLESHYRSQSKFSWESLQAAQNRLNGLQAFADLVFQPSGNAQPTLEADYLAGRWEAIKQALSDDLNTPEALKLVSEVVDKVSIAKLPATEIADLEVFLAHLDEAFGIQLTNHQDISSEQKQLINEREAARQARDWSHSDALRDSLQQQGIGLRDTADGAIWFRV